MTLAQPFHDVSSYRAPGCKYGDCGFLWDKLHEESGGAGNKIQK